MNKTIAAGLCAFLGLAGGDGAAAGECMSRPDRFEMRSDTVYWGFYIRPGAECLQGLRGKTQIIDAVRLIEAPKTGIVTVSGPSFRYQAASIPANDTFKVEIQGEDRRQRGTSVIIVEVVVK